MSFIKCFCKYIYVVYQNIVIIYVRAFINTQMAKDKNREYGHTSKQFVKNKKVIFINTSADLFLSM